MCWCALALANGHYMMSVCVCTICSTSAVRNVHDVNDVRDAFMRYLLCYAVRGNYCEYRDRFLLCVQCNSANSPAEQQNQHTLRVCVSCVCLAIKVPSLNSRPHSPANTYLHYLQNIHYCRLPSRRPPHTHPHAPLPRSRSKFVCSNKS